VGSGVSKPWNAIDDVDRQAEPIDNVSDSRFVILNRPISLYFAAAFSTCPPNSCRIADKTLSAKSASLRELNRS